MIRELEDPARAKADSRKVVAGNISEDETTSVVEMEDNNTTHSTSISEADAFTRCIQFGQFTPFSQSDAKILGPAGNVVFPRLSGQQISAEMSKINRWADQVEIEGGTYAFNITCSTLLSGLTTSSTH